MDVALAWCMTVCTLMAVAFTTGGFMIWYVSSNVMLHSVDLQAAGSTAHSAWRVTDIQKQQKYCSLISPYLHGAATVALHAHCGGWRLRTANLGKQDSQGALRRSAGSWQHIALHL